MRTSALCLVLLVLGACTSSDAPKASGGVLTIGDVVASTAKDGLWIWHETRVVRDEAEEPSILFMRRSQEDLAISATSRSRRDLGKEAQALLSLDEFESLVSFVMHTEPTSPENLDPPQTVWRSPNLTVALGRAEEEIFLSPWFGSEYFHRYLARDDFLEMARKTLAAVRP